MTLALTDIRAAADRIAPYVHHTPVMTSAAVDELVGARVALKCECFQRVGAFKARGAANAVLSLDDRQAARGVAAHSSGNHGQALAWAASLRDIPATIVMPRDASPVKLAGVGGYGAEIVLVEPTLAAREQGLADVVRATGAVEIHPYDDDRVIAGAGTAALELVDEVPGLDVVVGPVGGGGLMSGTCIAAHGLDPSIRVIGGEPAGADDAYRSLTRGSLVPSVDPHTIADGLRTSLSDRTFAILSEHLERIVTVDDDTIVDAMRFMWTRTKVLVEPSAAVAVAAAARADLEGASVGIILSGGNVDLDQLPWPQLA